MISKTDDDYHRKTKGRLIEIQYKSFTDNERQREATVLQFVVVIFGIISGFGYIYTHKGNICVLSIVFSVLAIAILTWIGEYILNSSYQFRTGQIIQSKIRNKYDYLDNVIPKYWDNSGKDEKKRSILTNYYNAHLFIIRFLIAMCGLLPYIVEIISDKIFLSYKCIWFSLTFLAMCSSFLFIKKRIDDYTIKYEDIKTNWDKTKCSD